MINFIIGFASCFVFLLLIGQIKRVVLFFKKRKVSELSENLKKGPDEQVAMGETIVAILNSGEPNERVISNIREKKTRFWKRIRNF